MSDQNIYVQALKKDNAELTKQNYDLSYSFLNPNKNIYKTYNSK